jgi:hypothetical protein
MSLSHEEQPPRNASNPNGNDSKKGRKRKPKCFTPRRCNARRMPSLLGSYKVPLLPFPPSSHQQMGDFYMQPSASQLPTLSVYSQPSGAYILTPPYTTLYSSLPIVIPSRRMDEHLYIYIMACRKEKTKGK